MKADAVDCSPAFTEGSHNAQPALADESISYVSSFVLIYSIFSFFLDIGVLFSG